MLHLILCWQRGPAPGKTNMPTDSKLWHARLNQDTASCSSSHQSHREWVSTPTATYRVAPVKSASDAECIKEPCEAVGPWMSHCLDLLRSPVWYTHTKLPMRWAKKTYCASVTGCSCQPLRQSKHWKSPLYSHGSHVLGSPQEEEAEDVISSIELIPCSRI